LLFSEAYDFFCKEKPTASSVPKGEFDFQSAEQFVDLFFFFKGLKQFLHIVKE